MCTYAFFLFLVIDTAVHIELNYLTAVSSDVRCPCLTYVHEVYCEYAGRGNLERQLRPSKTTGIGIVSIGFFAIVVISLFLYSWYISTSILVRYPISPIFMSLYCPGRSVQSASGGEGSKNERVNKAGVLDISSLNIATSDYRNLRLHRYFETWHTSNPVMIHYTGGGGEGAGRGHGATRASGQG